jgi:hypothetical protein
MYCTFSPATEHSEYRADAFSNDDGWCAAFNIKTQE